MHFHFDDGIGNIKQLPYLPHLSLFITTRGGVTTKQQKIQCTPMAQFLSQILMCGLSQCPFVFIDIMFGVRCMGMAVSVWRVCSLPAGSDTDGGRAGCTDLYWCPLACPCTRAHMQRHTHTHTHTCRNAVSMDVNTHTHTYARAPLARTHTHTHTHYRLARGQKCNIKL